MAHNILWAPNGRFTHVNAVPPFDLQNDTTNKGMKSGRSGESGALIALRSASAMSANLGQIPSASQSRVDSSGGE